eukprot:Skav215716  [mRNA]  locus=scaffold2573:521065:521628:+ [translate_table: standard]
MGKGGYGKGWSNKGRWQHSQHWQPPRDRSYWQEDRRQQPSETSVGNLCAGVVTSAFESVCSGVASATWAAVQGAAQAFMNTRQPASRTPTTTDSTCAPADMTRCLAGSSHPPIAASGQAEGAVLLLQKQLSALQEQQQAASKAPAASAAEPSRRKAKRLKVPVKSASKPGKSAAKPGKPAKKGKNKE